MVDVVGMIAAGMGLFFTGLKLVSGNFKQMASRRLRSLVARMTDSFWKAALLGVLSGAVLQSTSAITFILTSMISSGLVTVRRALPIVAWCNVGSSALVFMAVLNLRMAVLYLLGIAGASFAFEKPLRYRNAVGAIFGIGMLFYGIELMKSGAAPLKDFPWFNQLIAEHSDSYALAFLGGALLSFITQSSTAISVFGISMLQAGVLAPDQTIMVIYGANVGSTFSRMLLSTGLKGSPKQLAHFQDLFKFAGAALFVPLFYVEIYTQAPLVKALASILSDRIETQMAIVFLLFNLGTAVLLSLLLEPLYRMLLGLFRPSEHEDLAKVQYIYDQALHEPDTAMDLVEKEQLRLAKRLPQYMEVLRAGAGTGPDHRPIHTAFAAVALEVEAFLAELVKEPLQPETSGRVTNLQNRHSLLNYIEESLYSLTATLRGSGRSDKLQALVDRFVEGLDFVLLTALDAMESMDEFDIDLLITITADRGDLMEKIRKAYLASEEGLSYEDKSMLLHMTSLFERTVWMVARIGQLLHNARRYAVAEAS